MTEREERALLLVKRHMWWSMGAGLIPVPLVDLIAVSGVQLKMLSEVARIYGVPFQEARGKMLIGALTGFIIPSSLSFGVIGSLLKTIPLAGSLVGAPSMALFCGGSAWAMGKVFIQHFESGGTFLTFNPEEVRGYFQKCFEEGRRLAAEMDRQPDPEPPSSSEGA